MPLASKRLAGRSRSCAMVFTPRCYWPRRTDDSYQDIVAAGANGLGPSALPQPTTTLSCSVLTAKFFPPTSLGLDRARPTGAFKSSVTRMHGKAARPGKTIGFLSRENYYFPRPQSLSILPNSTSPFTLRASLKAFGQSCSTAGAGAAQLPAESIPWTSENAPNGDHNAALKPANTQIDASPRRRGLRG